MQRSFQITRFFSFCLKLHFLKKSTFFCCTTIKDDFLFKYFSDNFCLRDHIHAHSKQLIEVCLNIQSSLLPASLSNLYVLKLYLFCINHMKKKISTKLSRHKKKIIYKNMTKHAKPNLWAEELLTKYAIFIFCTGWIYCIFSIIPYWINPASSIRVTFPHFFSNFL